MHYPDAVRQHFFNPYHLGDMLPDAAVRTARAGSYALGAVVQIQLHCDGDTIGNAHFKAFGNPYLIACASFACQWLEGKSLSDVAAFNYQLIIDKLTIPKTKQHCAIIVEDAVTEALASMRETNECYS